MTVAKTVSALAFGLCAAANAQNYDFCNASGHSGEKYTTTKSYDKGEFDNGIGYEIWFDGGNNSATFYKDGSFSCSFLNSNDYLCRTGLSFNKTQTYKEIGNMYADFKLVKQNVSDVGYSYVGVYGWMSSVPDAPSGLVEFYIVDNWLSQYAPGDWVGDTKLGSVTIDGATYKVYRNTRTGPAIEGNGDVQFYQYFSVRTTARDCGRIDINAHFKAWEELGLKMGKMYEAKILGEAGNNESGGASGTADFPYAKVYVGTASDISSSSSSSSSSTSAVKPERAPYNGTPIALPGTVEAEEYDLGGAGVAFDGASEGKEEYANSMRPEDDVDIVGNGKGYAVGGILPGQWMEYTINVAESKYMVEVFAANGGENPSKITLSVDGKNVTTIEVPNKAGAWDSYEKVEHPEAFALTAGEHILRITFDDGYVNIDNVKFITVGGTESSSSSLETSANTESSSSSPKTDGSESSSSSEKIDDVSGIAHANFKVDSRLQYAIFDIQGKFIASVHVAKGVSLNEAVNARVQKPGIYLVKQGNAFQKIVVKH